MQICVNIVALCTFLNKVENFITAQLKVKTHSIGSYIIYLKGFLTFVLGKENATVASKTF